MQRITIADGWELRERDDAGFEATEGWLPATVPGSVQLDLLAAAVIPDPFYGTQEDEVQWVGERDWLYRCVFDLPLELAASPRVDLCFDGLDTFATVWLNGQLVLRSDNQFVPQRVPVKPLLQPHGNELRILFESPLRIGREREEQHGVRPVWNGDPSRVYVRKAQYSYGWDWGPTLLTVGPWKPVYLEGYDARIVDLHCPTEVSDDLRRASLPVALELDLPEGACYELAFELRDADGTLIDSANIEAEDSPIKHHFELESPRLWWPRGRGEQHLYRVSATLTSAGSVEDRRERRVGIRRLRLVQAPFEDEPGTSFLFEVNDEPVFAGGYNWIPADSFPTRVTPDRYHDWLRLAADGNASMLRVWGGGYYEADAFYDMCDELGLLVWQDFMFACGMYPAYREFQASVRAEAEAAVRRLRHHPSIALWCGNNEDYSIAASLGAYDPDYQGDLAESPFPARALYERLLPEVCARLDPTRQYWSGSPYGGANPDDPNVGDRHVWEVWHGSMAPYQGYPEFTSRFVSEFGMQAYPDRATIEEFAPEPEQRPRSRTVEHHDKAEGGSRRLAVYLADNLDVVGDLDGFIYATQLVQAEALAAGIRGWRRRWRGPGMYYTSGALVWQLDDCWPASSWAVADSELRPKPAYYVVRRELAPVVVGLAVDEVGTAVWASNGTREPVDATLELAAWSLDGDQAAGESRRVRLEPFGSVEPGAFNAGPPLVVAAQLVQGEDVIARAALWPEPYKHLDLPDPGVSVEREGDRLLVSGERPAKGVVLSAGPSARWSDNCLDLLPNDPRSVTVEGDGEQVTVRWLSSTAAGRGG